MSALPWQMAIALSRQVLYPQVPQLTQLCDFDLSVFTEDADGRYRREDESHTERCYTLSELTETLTETGFELIAVHGDFDGNPPTEDCERWYVVARAKKD